jgi:hypothetical protein
LLFVPGFIGTRLKILVLSSLARSGKELFT